MAATTSSKVHVLGVDPAPKKETAVWSSGRLETIAAGDVRSFLSEQLEASPALLVVWDSPLVFDPVAGFSDRPFDRAARRWVADNVRGGRIEQGAVSVRPFSGCPHWAHSCHVLGLPFGEKIPGLELYSGSVEIPEAGRGLVVETHPAVALAALWIELELEEPFPRYKGARVVAGRVAHIAETLGFPPEAAVSDDALDAYTAHLLGQQLLVGESRFSGSLRAGGYLLPALRSCQPLDSDTK